MHQPYERKLGFPADFRVRYTFFDKEEGGRSKFPFQGIRSDFWYDFEGHSQNQLYMIWPEFEDSLGNIILDNSNPLPKTGTARMWIIVPERRPYHQGKIKVGMKGYFRDGEMVTGACEVIEILGLFTNPTH